MAKQTLQVLQSPLDHDEAFTAALLFRSTPASAFDYHWRVRIPPGSGSKSGSGPGSGACRDSTEHRQVES